MITAEEQAFCDMSQTQFDLNTIEENIAVLTTQLKSCKKQDEENIKAEILWNLRWFREFSAKVALLYKEGIESRIVDTIAEKREEEKYAKLPNGWERL